MQQEVEILKYTHIIWDWNGTLLDDIKASLASVNDMLELREKAPIDIAFYKECIGVPIIKFYEKVFELEKEDYSVIIKQYNEGYLRHLTDCSLSSGAAEMLEYFAENGAKQAIVSSSNNEHKKLLLSAISQKVPDTRVQAAPKSTPPSWTAVWMR